MCFVYIVNLEFWKTVAKSQPGSLVKVAMSIRQSVASVPFESV